MEKDKFILSGLSENYLESGTEQRDPMQEFIEDYEVLGASLRVMEFDLDRIGEVAEKKKLKIKEQIVVAQGGLSGLISKWKEIGEQGELFSTLEDEQGNQASVKQRDLDILKKDIAEWFSLVAGFKNVGDKITKDFQEVKDLSSSIFSSENDQKKQFYGRGFSESIYEWEKNFAKEAGVKDVALCNSGMSAIETCLRSAELKEGDNIMVGKDFYIYTQFLLAEMERRGIKIRRFESGNLSDEDLAEHKPKLILFEGMANALEMETVDIKKLLKQNSDYNEKNPGNKCRLVLDNTFASIALLNLPKITRGLNLKDAKWAVVESATKHYQAGRDNINAGIVYSDDVEFVRLVKEKRAIIGTNLQQKLVSYLPKLDAELLSQKMMRHSMNAMLLASYLEKNGLEVKYPDLESHPQHETAKKIYPEGVGGVFYIRWDNKKGNPQEFINQIAKEGEKIGVDIKIGVSFGHPETWLEAVSSQPWQEGDKNQWEIRIMAGEENIAKMKKVLEVFNSVFNKKQTLRTLKI